MVDKIFVRLFFFTVYFNFFNLLIAAIINTSVERGCTPQRDVFQAYDFNKRAWHNQERIVESAYQEGCTIGEDRGSPGGPSEYCFCSGDLCNSSISLTQYHFHHILYLSTFSLIIFLRNQL